MNPPFNGMRLSAGAFTQLFEAGSEFALSRTYGYANNAAGFYDDRWTMLASSVATELDVAKRKQLYSDINDFLLDAAFTMAITPYPDIVALRPKRHGPDVLFVDRDQRSQHLAHISRES